jgi:ribonuclease I
MKKISKLAISIPSTAIAVTGVTAGITSCGKNEPQSKINIQDVLTNTVVIDPKVTKDASTLDENEIFKKLKDSNPDLKTENLRITVNSYCDESIDSNIYF